MNKETKTLLYFVGGVIWAIATARKAYAPNLQTVEIDAILSNNSDIATRDSRSENTLVRKTDPTGVQRMYAKRDIDCPDWTRANPFGCCRQDTPECDRCMEIYRDTPYRCDPKPIIHN